MTIGAASSEACDPVAVAAAEVRRIGGKLRCFLT